MRKSGRFNRDGCSKIYALRVDRELPTMGHKSQRFGTIECKFGAKLCDALEQLGPWLVCDKPDKWWLPEQLGQELHHS